MGDTSGQDALRSEEYIDKMPVQRKFTVKRDLFDPRDLVVVGSGPSNLPVKYQLNPLVQVKDQGDLGACTAFTGSSMAEYLIRKYSKWIKGLTGTDEEKGSLAASTALSPMFQYYNERVMEGDVSEDAGASGRTMMQALTKYGVCLEKFCPYNPKQFTDKPSDNAYNNALGFKLGAYHRVLDSETAKSVVFSGYPVSLSVEVYASFESDEVAKNGLVPVPGANEEYEGGHEIWMYGWDDTLRFPDGNIGGVLFQNHWGTDWGAQGRGALPYVYIDNRQLTSDMWTGHFGKPWKKPITLEQHIKLIS